jgi:uncharacterized protein (DUF1499 family)
MKSLAMIVVGLVLVGFLAYVVMAFLSQKQPDNLGLQNGQLKPCPDSPNCVCSESHSQSDAQHFIEAIKGNKQTWVKLKQTIIEQGGHIQTESSDYMHITFSTAVFHYVDDVEARFDRAQHVIHLRSASRIGRSDFGVNRQRIKRIKKALLD